MLCIYLRAGDGMGLSRDLWEAPRKASWALDLNRRLGLGWGGQKSIPGTGLQDQRRGGWGFRLDVGFELHLRP